MKPVTESSMITRWARTAVCAAIVATANVGRAQTNSPTAPVPDPRERIVELNRALVDLNKISDANVRMEMLQRLLKELKETTDQIYGSKATPQIVDYRTAMTWVTKWRTENAPQVDALLRQGQGEQAIELVTRGMTTYPAIRSEMLAIRGSLKLHLGRVNEAWTDYESAVQGHPCPVLARTMRIDFLNRTGNPDRATAEHNLLNGEIARQRGTVAAFVAPTQPRQPVATFSVPNQPTAPPATIPRPAANPYDNWGAAEQIIDRIYKKTENRIANIYGKALPHPEYGLPYDPVVDFTQKMDRIRVSVCHKLADPNVPMSEKMALLNNLRNHVGRVNGVQAANDMSNQIRNSIDRYHQNLIDSRACWAEIYEHQYNAVMLNSGVR